MVQSEFYLKESEAQSHEGDQTEFKDVSQVLYELDFSAAMHKQPTQVVFNGHQRSLIDAPLATLPGERMRLYLFDAPEGSSMRTLAIAIYGPEASFERAVREATPLLDSIEFHAR